MSVRYTTSQEVMHCLKNGDREILITLYKEHEEMIKQFIMKNNGSLEDAEDLLQDALVILWQNARKTDFELTSQPGTYLYSIVKNLWLKQFNRNKRMVDDKNVHLTASDDSYSADSGQLDLAIVRKYLNEMGETCRQVLLMFYFDGFDMKTIAQANHFANPNVAKAKKHQCLQELAKQVKSKFSSTDFYKS